MTKILVTGGAGYIGSHTVKKLNKKGYETLIIDDLSYGNEKLVLGKELIVADIVSKEAEEAIKKFQPEGVIHFAAFKDAGESVYYPEKYFYNNTAKTILFLDCLIRSGVKNFIFSSTAAVYGDVNKVPITEDFETLPTNPYGYSKLMVEGVLQEYQKAGKINPIIFRYFNAGGADSEGELGNMYPDAKDVVSVLMRVAKENGAFSIFGTDYKTKDGTCVRDIIHVDDLADAHVLGLEKLLKENKTGIYNLGSQEGFTIREIIDTAKTVTGVDFKVKEGDRRPGDVVVSIASSKKAEQELGWKKNNGIADIIESAWSWERKNVR